MSRILPVRVKILDLKGAMTQETLVQKSGIPKRTLQRVLSGRRQVSFFTLQKLAKFFSLPTSELIADSKPNGKKWLEVAESNGTQEKAVRAFWAEFQRAYDKRPICPHYFCDAIERYVHSEVVMDFAFSDPMPWIASAQGEAAVVEAVRKNMEMGRQYVDEIDIGYGSDHLFIALSVRAHFNRGEVYHIDGVETLKFRDGKVLYATAKITGFRRQS